MKIFILPLFLLFSINLDISNDLASFEIEVKRTGDTVKMKCTKGCNWTDIKFNLNSEGTWIINEFGVHAKTDYHHEDEISFAFEVLPTENGLKFESINGSAWKELKYGNKPNRGMYLNATGVYRKRD